MKNHSHRNLSQSAKDKLTKNLVCCHFHGLSAAAGGRCLRCAKEAKAARRKLNNPR